MNRVSIKLCGINTFEALDAAISAGATHVGLVFFSKSPRNVSVEQAAALAQRTNGRAQVVGLFVDPDRGQVEATCRDTKLDVIQLHGTESPERTAEIRRLAGLEVWKAIGVRKRADLAAALAYQGAVDRILYDAKPPESSELPGGTGLRIDWTVMKDHAHPLPWILAGGLDASNVADAIGITGAGFVDTSSGIESAPGVKDPARIAAFCAAARSA